MCACRTPSVTLTPTTAVNVVKNALAPRSAHAHQLQNAVLSGMPPGVVAGQQSLSLAHVRFHKQNTRKPSVQCAADSSIIGLFAWFFLFCEYSLFGCIQDICSSSFALLSYETETISHDHCTLLQIRLSPA